MTYHPLITHFGIDILLHTNGTEVLHIWSRGGHSSKQRNLVLWLGSQCRIQGYRCAMGMACVLLCMLQKSHSHTHQDHWFTGSLSVWSHGYRKLFGQYVTLVVALSIVCIRVVTPCLLLPLGLKLLLPLYTAWLLAQQISLFVFTLQFEEYTLGNGSHYCTSLA